jgi:hypothetical protein
MSAPCPPATLMSAKYSALSLARVAWLMSTCKGNSHYSHLSITSTRHPPAAPTSSNHLVPPPWLLKGILGWPALRTSVAFFSESKNAEVASVEKLCTVGQLVALGGAKSSDVWPSGGGAPCQENEWRPSRQSWMTPAHRVALCKGPWRETGQNVRGAQTVLLKNTDSLLGSTD